MIDGERALSRILRYPAFMRIAVNDKTTYFHLDLNTGPLKGIYPVLIRGACRYDAIVESGPGACVWLLPDNGSPRQKYTRANLPFALVQLPQL